MFHVRLHPIHYIVLSLDHHNLISLTDKNSFVWCYLRFSCILVWVLYLALLQVVEVANFRIFEECRRAVFWARYCSFCTPRNFFSFWRISLLVMLTTPLWWLLCHLQAMNRDLVRVNAWYDLWWIKLNASKTKTMIVPRSKTPEQLLKDFLSWGSPGGNSMINCSSGDAFGVLSWQFWNTVVQCGVRLPIHTLKYWTR